MREYEKNVLHPIRPTLSLDTPISQAYIILTDTGILAEPVNYGTPIENLDVGGNIEMQNQGNQYPSNQQHQQANYQQQPYYEAPLVQQQN